MPDMWIDVDTAVTVPVNLMPLIDDGDFKSRETSVAYDATGMDLVWNFVTSAGVITQTAVTPTTGGSYDWSHVGDGIYKIEIPASGGASINNDTEGYGWFSGIATGVLPWRGPVIGFRAAALNDALCDGGDLLDVNVTQMGGSTQSATDLKDFADDGYDPSTNKVQGVVLTDTVTTLTNAPSDSSGVTSLLNRLTSTRAGYLDNLSGGAVALASQILDAAGIRTAVGLASANLDTQFGLVATASKLLKYFQLLLRKDAAIATDNATELTAINANGGSGAGAFANTTDSVEAIRDRGDAAWATATGFSTLDAAGVRSAVGMASANLDTQLGSLATAAELAKVPKSDGTSTWNATALAAIQSECADALAASDAIGAASISAAAGSKIADIMLRRTSANIEASSNGDTLAFKSLYGAIAMQTHEKDASSGTSLEVKKADGSTTLATITLDTDAAAEPIVGTGSA